VNEEQRVAACFRVDSTLSRPLGDVLHSHGRSIPSEPPASKATAFAVDLKRPSRASRLPVNPDGAPIRFASSASPTASSARA
jgi:hypothetical protein